MKIYRSRTMWLVILVYQLVLIGMVEAQVPHVCTGHASFKPPENSDMTVICGTEYMEMEILLCPVYHSNYNESLMVLNDQVDKRECFGVADLNADPPVLKFKFLINDTSGGVCNNNIKISDGRGTGEFSDFSNVQHVNVSGMVSSVDPSVGTITYRSHIMYMFSCVYPLQYLVNNTQLGVSGVNLAIKDNNGSFVSTLTMGLYSDDKYTLPLVVPQTGLNLRTKIFVRVKATNLTTRFNVLLDRCYATVSPNPAMITYYDLFVGCAHDTETQVNLNGEAQRALFEFKAFRFVEHKNLTVSTFYLHCITRLCDVNECRSIKPNCEGGSGRRRRRAAEDVPTNVTITSTPIIVAAEEQRNDAINSAHGTSVQTTFPVAVLVCIALFALSSL